MTHRETIEAYYRAFKESDKETLQRILAEDLRHRSPFGLYEDRDRMIEEIWPSVGRSWAEDVEIFGDGPTYMIRYRITGPGGTDRIMAESMRFEGDRIAEVEVYAGRELA